MVWAVFSKLFGAIMDAERSMAIFELFDGLSQREIVSFAFLALKTGGGTSVGGGFIGFCL